MKRVIDIEKTLRIILLSIALFLSANGISALLFNLNPGGLLVFAGVFLLLLALLNYIAARYKYKLRRLITAVILIVLSCGTIALCITSLQMAGKLRDSPAPENAVMIILGCGLNNTDQTSPSEMLKARLDKAAQYLKFHPGITVCVLSGGQGANEKISEANAMFNYLTAQGIDESRLYIENRSENTRENIALSQKLLIENNLLSAQDEGKSTNLILVTNDFHQFRAQHIAAQHGFKSFSLSAKTPSAVIVTYWLRETVGIILQIWIKGIWMKVG